MPSREDMVAAGVVDGVWRVEWRFSAWGTRELLGVRCHGVSAFSVVTRPANAQTKAEVSFT